MLAAIINTICNATGVFLGKIISSQKNMSGLILMKLQMLFVAVIMLVPVFVWGSFKTDIISWKYVLLFGALVVVGVIQNILFFSTLRKKNLCEIEPITILVTPTTIVLAMLLFPDERNLFLLAVSAVATIALIVSRFDKGKLDFDKYSWRLVAFDIVYAIEAILIKYLLGVTNAVSLYGMRTAFIAVILFLVFTNIKVDKVKTKDAGKILFNSMVTCAENIARLIAISTIGIVNSSLIFLLSPVIVIILSRTFLKEKITVKRGIGDIVILVCVVTVVVFSY